MVNSLIFLLFDLLILFNFSFSFFLKNDFFFFFSNNLTQRLVLPVNPKLVGSLSLLWENLILLISINRIDFWLIITHFCFSSIKVSTFFAYGFLLCFVEIQSSQGLCNIYKPHEESQRANYLKEALTQLLTLVHNKFQPRWFDYGFHHNTLSLVLLIPPMAGRISIFDELFKLMSRLDLMASFFFTLSPYITFDEL